MGTDLGDGSWARMVEELAAPSRANAAPRKKFRSLFENKLVGDRVVEYAVSGYRAECPC